MATRGEGAGEGGQSRRGRVRDSEQLPGCVATTEEDCRMGTPAPLMLCWPLRPQSAGSTNQRLPEAPGGDRLPDFPNSLFCIHSQKATEGILDGRPKSQDFAG